jgi:hypothetical protein
MALDAVEQAAGTAAQSWRESPENSDSMDRKEPLTPGKAPG